MRRIQSIGSSVLLALTFATCKPKPVERLPAPPPVAVPARSSVSGQVFVVTQGAQNIKLGLAPICIYSGEQFEQLRPVIEEEARAEKIRVEKEAADVAASLKSDQEAVNYYQEQIAVARARIEQDPESEWTRESAQGTINYWSQRLAKMERTIVSERKRLSTVKEQHLHGQEPTASKVFAKLPSDAVARTKTDADGRFDIELPPVVIM
jgi:hypothetical protein